jgi:hypothetical protein
VAPAAWPSELPLPEAGFIEVLLLIGRDGLAQLESCELPVVVCDAVAAALLESEFAPATLEGVPRAARVSLRMGLAPASAPTPGSSPSEPTPAAPSPPAVPVAVPLPADVSEDYGAQALVTRPNPTAHALTLEQMREVPGTQGDPFRVLDALPGVVPVMTGLPYVYVRGAPPAATAYFYDDIQLPALFHLGLGPAVVHSAMVGPIDFYPGVAPARYGRRTGGVVAGKAALRTLKPGVHGELELRLVDVQAYVAKPFGHGGRVELAGRYGYPGLLIQAFEPRAIVQYWDYQMRTVIPLSRDTEASVIALGSFDYIGEKVDGRRERQLELQFHRVEARLVQRRGALALGTAVSAGFEHSALGEDIDVKAFRLGPKLWLDTAIRKAALRFGADMLATFGRIGNPLEDENEHHQEGQPEQDLATQNPIYRSAMGRNVIGAYTELRLPLGKQLELDAGLRGDVWLTGGDVQQALEPRSLLRLFANERWTFHAAAGLAYQPAVFLIPLPGIADVSLDRGLQRAVQMEVGAQVALPAAFSAEVKLFTHLYKDMLSLDAIDQRDVDCVPDGGFVSEENPMQPVSCTEKEGFARISARAYGSEWMLRRDFKETLSGWISYTLSKADARSDGGLELTPNFDVRHVANLILQWRISPKWHLSLRGFAQSGRYPLASNTASDPRERQRLPAFYRGDLQFSRIWPRSWGEVRFTFDWLNFTFQREPFNWTCDNNQQCSVEYVEFPVTLPMLGVRGSY